MEEEGAEPGDVEELTQGPTASRGGARAPRGPASWGPALGQLPSPHTLSCPAFSEDLVRLRGDPPLRSSPCTTHRTGNRAGAPEVRCLRGVRDSVWGVLLAHLWCYFLIV